jgi:hypothetical protein
MPSPAGGQIAVTDAVYRRVCPSFAPPKYATPRRRVPATSSTVGQRRAHRRAAAGEGATSSPGARDVFGTLALPFATAK